MRKAGPAPASTPRFLLLVGLGACGLALLLMLFDARAALGGWLAAAFVWSSVPLGALPILLMICLIPGGWREQLLPGARVAVLLAPLVLLALLPVLLGAGALFPWVGAPRDGFQGVYLTRWFLGLRAVLFLCVVGAIIFLLAARPHWSAPIAASGLVVFVPLHTVFTVDWLMSLEPDFHSSGFGLYVLSIQTTIALSVLILARAFTAAGTAVRTPLLAGLLLTALLLWAYFAFMQYVIIWSGNLPNQVAWYQHHATGFWPVVEIAIGSLALGPAFLLLFPPIRRDRIRLCALAGATLLGKALEGIWLVLPGSTGPAIALSAALLSLAGLGAVSWALVTSRADVRALLGRRLPAKARPT